MNAASWPRHRLPVRPLHALADVKVHVVPSGECVHDVRQRRHRVLVFGSYMVRYSYIARPMSVLEA